MNIFSNFYSFNKISIWQVNSKCPLADKIKHRFHFLVLAKWFVPQGKNIPKREYLQFFLLVFQEGCAFKLPNTAFTRGPYRKVVLTLYSISMCISMCIISLFTLFNPSLHLPSLISSPYWVLLGRSRTEFLLSLSLEVFCWMSRSLFYFKRYSRSMFGAVFCSFGVFWDIN